MRELPLRALLALAERGEGVPALLLLGGDSEFLMERAARALAGSVPEEERPLCLWRGSAAEADADRLLTEASTAPMLGRRRVLIVREAEKLPVSDHPGWRSYLRRPLATTVAAFMATPGADSKALRELSEACARVNCQTPPARSLPGWLAAEARSLGCSLDADTAAWMVELAGRDLAALSAWLERCLLYRGRPGRLDRQDLESVCARRAPANLFSWSDRVGEGRAAEALRLAQRALEDGEEALALLSRAANHLRRLARIRRALEAGAAPAEAARRAGVPAFLAGSAAAQARACSEGGLGRALARCAGTDRALKSSRVTPARVLDRWVIETARGQDP